MKERITVRMTTEMIERIDAWIAHQPGYVSRQDAVRHCVDLMLGQPTAEGALATSLERGGQPAPAATRVEQLDVAQIRIVGGLES